MTQAAKGKILGKRFIIFGAVATLIIIALVAALFLAPQAPPPPPPTSPPPKPKELRIPAFWAPPPGFHGNPFGTWEGLAEIRWYIYEPGAYVIIDTDEWIPALFESWERQPDALLVRLRRGVTWHDGTAFTAKDVETLLVLRQAIYGWLLDVNLEVVDDYTVRLTKKELAESEIREFLQEYQCAPHHLFGQYLSDAKRIVDLRRRGQPYEAELKALYDKVAAPLYPGKVIGTGPYVLKEVTADYILLEKYAKHYAADKFPFDRLVLTPRLIAQEVIWTAMSAGETDFRQVPTPPAMLEAINTTLKAKGAFLGVGISYDPAEFGFLFNFRKWPYNDVRFRKALAYVIDVEKITEATFPGFALPARYQTGIPRGFEDMVFRKEFLATLKPYRPNPAEAERLLKELGFTRGPDGKWLGPDGKPFEIWLRPYAPDKEKMMPAEVLKEQLEKFGFIVKMDPVPLGLMGEIYGKGEFDILAEPRGIPLGAYTFDPIYAYIRIYGPGSTVQSWQGYDPWPVITIEGKTYNTKELVDRYFATKDPEEKRRIIETLAYITHEWLPGIAYFQKKMMWLHVDGIRATGWPKGYHPVYSAWIGGGEPKIIILLMRLGLIRPTG
ncbi:MAG: ABC transporter substrate-binding protein [Thermofilaceae archaeon]